MKSTFFVVLLSAFLFCANAHADRTIITVNKSSQPIWVGAEGKLVDPANPFNPTPVNPNRGGWYLAPNGGSVTVTVPNGWEGRFWGRTNCKFDANGNGSCETGNCTAGLYCDGLWGKSSTLAEMKFNGWNDLDFYDVSLIDGFNVPIEIVPVPGTFTPNGDKYYAGIAGCETDVNIYAPPELQIKNSKGDVIAWQATCEKFNTDKYCCYANDPATCHPNEYSVILKNACPNAYSYVTDHPTSTFASKAQTVYQVVFPEKTIPEGSAIATFYKHCNYDGTAISLAAGSYTQEQLNVKGILNNDLSSLKILSGYKVELFDNSNFTGDTIALTANSDCLVSSNWNDKASSIRISTSGCTPSATTPYVAINGGAWLQQTTASAAIGNKVSLAPHPLKEAGWKWIGPNGFSSTSREISIENIQTFQAGEYKATYTNEGGCQSTATFTVSVSSNTFSKKMQAESFSNMSGVQIENGANTDGGKNVGYIDYGDWMQFGNIEIPTSGTYKIEYRVASMNGGGKLSLDINSGSTILGTLDIPATGGWYNWVTLTHTVQINAGTYYFGIFAQTGGWNLDYWTITKL